MTNKFKINNVEFKVCSFIGRVVDNQTYSETYVSGGGGYIDRHGGSFNPVVSNTYTTKDFFLISNTGEEKHFSFTNKPIPAIRPGHIVEVMWVIPEHKSRGPYLLVRNVSLNKNYFDKERALNLLVEEKAFSMMTLSTFFICEVIGFILITIFLVNLAKGGPDYTLWLIPLFPLLLIIMGIYTKILIIKSDEIEEELLQELLKRITILR